MYKISVIRGCDNEEIISRLMELPPNPSQQEAILSYCVAECYIDICRLPRDTISDTANFRHIVEADLEPFDNSF